MKYYAAAVISLMISFNLYADCGSASCPLYHFHYNKAGGFYLRLSSEYINQNQIYTGSNKSFVGAVHEEHQEISTLNSITILQVQYGLTGTLSLNLLLPYIHREHRHIGHEDGEHVTESWNFNGFGDMIISGSYAVIMPSMMKEVYLGLQFGIKIPSGKTNAVNSSGEKAEITIQPGTGSWDAILGINFNYPLFTFGTPFSDSYSTVPLILGLSYQIPGKGTDDYRYGNTFLFNLGTDYQLSSNFSLNLQINTRVQGFAEPGNTGEPGENTGGVWLYLSPGLSFSISDTLSLFGYIQLPAYQNVNGIQQTSKYNLQAGITADI